MNILYTESDIKSHVRFILKHYAMLLPIQNFENKSNKDLYLEIKEIEYDLSLIIKDYVESLNEKLSFYNRIKHIQEKLNKDYVLNDIEKNEFNSILEKCNSFYKKLEEELERLELNKIKEIKKKESIFEEVDGILI